MSFTETDHENQVEAEYAIEVGVTCPSCRAEIDRLHVVRLLRTKVNFTSNLPRRGCVFACPKCRAFLSATISARLGL